MNFNRKLTVVVASDRNLFRKKFLPSAAAQLCAAHFLVAGYFEPHLTLVLLLRSTEPAHRLMAQVYEVPVLYSELRPAESYVQIHDTLRSLEHVVTEVFNRVLGRVQSERAIEWRSQAC